MQINNNSNDFLNLTDQEKMLTMSKYAPLHIKSNDFFLKIDQVSNYIGFVTKGLLRSYFYDDKANEITTAFFPEGSLILSANSFNNRVPAKESIVAIEDSELMVISYESQKELYELIPAWNAICKNMADNNGNILLERATQFQTLSAAERYEKFCREYNDILQRVTLGHIASYIGIDLATLSRIRKKK
jgi:CRP/FNR family transcriptional regulator, anaerobic regulatory protein